MTPAFASSTKVAERLGVSSDTFRRMKPRLTKAGFPEPDPVLGRYLMADVDAWIRARRTIPDDDNLRFSESETQEINLAAL